MTELLLASRSAARIAMLAAAGVPVTALPADIDEESLKAALLADGVDPLGIADALAGAKAIALSRLRPGALVLGCDSTVEAADGALIGKVPDRAAAARQLRWLAGTSHRLHSAAVMARDGIASWRHADSAVLAMRDLSAPFLEDYLDREWPAIAGCVGGYRLEGLGAQLFTRIEGSYFTILGLPLLPVLDYLREAGVIPA